MGGYRWLGEDEERAKEVGEKLAELRAIAASRVPEWAPWMTVERGYAAQSQAWLRHHGWQTSAPKGE